MTYALATLIVLSLLNLAVSVAVLVVVFCRDPKCDREDDQVLAQLNTAVDEVEPPATTRRHTQTTRKRSRAEKATPS